MFERYTEAARRAIFFGRYEASQLGSPYIEIEHLMLGFLREDKALQDRLGGQNALELLRRQIAESAPVHEKVSTTVDLPMDRACKRALSHGSQESERLGHTHIGTEHLLIGILMEDKSLAARLLRERGVQLSTVRQELANAPPKGDPPPPVIYWAHFTMEARRATFLALKEASQLGSASIEIEHLLLGVLQEGRLEVTLLLRSDKALEAIRQLEAIGQRSREPTPSAGAVSCAFQPEMSQRYQRALAWACEVSEQMGSPKVTTGHLLLAILNEHYGLARFILNWCGVTPASVRAGLGG